MKQWLDAFGCAFMLLAVPLVVISALFGSLWLGFYLIGSPVGSIIGGLIWFLILLTIMIHNSRVA